MSLFTNKQKGYFKNHTRKPLSSSTNTKSSQSKKKSSLRKLKKERSKIQISLNGSSTTISNTQDNQQNIRNRQIFYEKYKKNQFPNISIIEQKQSILSNNQQNSLDSLNNYMINGNKLQNSVQQKSKQESSSDQIIEDWSALQKQYEQLFQKEKINQSLNQQLGYFEALNQILHRIQQKNISQQPQSPIWLKKQLFESKQYAKEDIQKENMQSQSFCRLKIVGSNLYKQQKSANNNTQNQKSFILKIENIQNTLPKLQQISKNKNKELQNDSKKKSQSSQILQQSDENNQSKTSKSVILKDIKSIKAGKIEQKILQNLEDQEENKYNSIEGQIIHSQQVQGKGVQEFIQFNEKKFSENQPNLSINNISKIMKYLPKQNLNNKSVQNQMQTKEKEDDEVVAMLQNELKQKQILQMPGKQQSQILKQSQDNLCLNQLEGQIQNHMNSQQNQQQQTTIGQNAKLFFVLQSRQKWIRSLADKDEKWKANELALISKMKKILHNPYIEFPEESFSQII